MLECVPYIKSICHQVWLAEWGDNSGQIKDINTKKDEQERYEVKGFQPNLINTSLCVVDDLIVNDRSDEIFNQRSSEVITKHEQEINSEDQKGKKVEIYPEGHITMDR